MVYGSVQDKSEKTKGKQTGASAVALIPIGFMI
jgi:hypothetical protein